MKKKILAAFLVLMTLLSIMPVSVFAFDYNPDGECELTKLASGKDTYVISHIDIFADFVVPIVVDGKVYNFDPQLTTDDAQYVTYSGRYADGTAAEAKLTSVGTSEDDTRGTQIRLGADGTSEDNYLEAGTKTDPVYWTVSFSKTYKVYVGEDTISTTSFEGGVEYEVPFSFSATIDYWNADNECPAGPYWGKEEGIAYDEDLEIPQSYSGIDLDLGGKFGTITIQKNISGCELTEDKTFIFNVYYLNGSQVGEKTIYMENVGVTVKAGKTMGQTTLVKVPFGSYEIIEVSTAAQIDGFSVDTQYGSESVTVSKDAPSGLQAVTNKYTPITYKLTYHVEGDPSYGIPKDSTTPTQVTGIAYNGEVDLVDADGTVKTTQTYAAVSGKQIPGTWKFVEHWTEDETDPDKGDITTDKVSEIKEDKDVYGQWTFTPDTYTLTYHVVDDEKYGIPTDSVTPEKVEGIEYNADEDLESVPTTEWKTSDGTDQGIPGTWEISEYWTEDDTNPDKADITESKIEKITENKDVYSKWTFTPDTYTLTYHVEEDPTYGIPKDSKTPDPVTQIAYDGEVDLVDADDTVTTKQFYAEVGDKQIPGTWTFVEYWTEDDAEPDKADITTDKVSNIKEDKDVYGQWLFTPAKTSVILNGHKTFNNFPEDSKIEPVFTFTLSENDSVIDTKTVTKSGDYAFDSITYTEPGEHTYVIAETDGKLTGVSYAENTYTIKVTVTDDGQGHLVTAITGDSTTGTDLNFTNGYKAKPVDVTFSGMKTMNGRDLADEEFSFTLSGNGTNETVKNGADGKITFSKLTFDKAGTYDYTVKEESSNEAGITIDSKVYNVTVTVTDDGSGQLKAAISGDTTTGTDLNFANKYVPGSTSVTLKGHKTFNNFPEDSKIEPEFTFTLSENDSVIDTKTVTKSGTYAFDSITYTEPGTHVYTVAETKGSQAGVTYDTNIYTVTVKVEDDKKGSLAATITGINSDGSGLDFTNGYKAKPVDVTFSGMKTLSGRDLADKEFSFTLSGNGTNETVKNGADGKITFSKQTFDKVGTYTYTVKEEASNKDGITIDSKVYSITVTVTDDGSGQLKAAISGDTTTGTDLNFKNTYKAGSTSVILSGHKTFNNFPEDSKIKPEFTFTLSEKGEVIDTKTVTKSGDYAFDSITYTEPGEHTYVVAETDGKLAGISYAENTYTIKVTVTDDGQGHLVTAITGDSTTGTDLNFTNGYKAKAVEVQFSGIKTLEGRTLADQEFSFTLSGNGTTETVKNGADGKIVFSKLTFDKADTYTYTVKEESSNEAGITIDSKIYSITVTVTDDGNGQLKAAISGDTTTGTDLNFANKYVPGSTSVTLSGHKTFNNFPEKSEIEPEFTFTLSENDSVIDTKTVTKSGDYAFDSITYTEEGTHTYTVKETKDNQSGVTYDTNTYTVTVKVEDNKKGALVATITGINSDGSGLNFTNRYKAESVDVRFSGKKTLSGRDLADKEFSFTLKGNGISETVKNDAEGNIGFSKLTFNKVGTYTFTVKEEATDEAGVTIDSNIYGITVTVTDDGSGQLKAAISGDTTTGTDLNFANKYVPGSTSVILSGHKTFNNFPANSKIEPVFTFTLSENDGVIDTKTVTKSGDFAFDSITYEKEGTYTYTVAEKKDDQAGVTYDTNTYTVTVKVEDNKKGALVATITGINADGSGLVFTNDYEAKPVEVQFSGTKTLEGRKLADQEFSFTLTDADGKPVETVKNGADGKITFSKLTFDKAGVYTYTVKEDATTKPGVTVDSKIYSITVTVTDDGSGQLKAAISGDTLTGTDLNFKNVFKYGSLTISKQVTGDLGDKNKLFTFTVTFDVDGVYSYTGSKTGIISGGGSVQLKHGESITIAGIPDGTNYTVVESNNEGYRVYKTGDVGTIVADQDSSASYTNAKSTVPQTGDSRHLVVWMCIMIVSFIGIIGTLVFSKRKRGCCER